MFSGALDLLGLGVVWYAIDGIANGLFTEIRISNFEFVDAIEVNESSVAMIGMLALVLFALRSIFSILTLAKLRSSAVQFERCLVRQILTTHLSKSMGGGSTGRKQLPGIQHGIVSARTWVAGSVSGFSALIVETAMVLSTMSVMLLASPGTTIGLILFLSIASLLMQRVISSQIRREARVQRESAKAWMTNLSGALSVRSQLRVHGKSTEWIGGITSEVEEGSQSYAQTFFLNSLPRYVLEFLVLISVAFVIGISFLVGDFDDNAAGAALVLAGAFRISGGLLPIQSSLNRMAHSEEMGKAVMESMTANTSHLANERVAGLLTAEVDKLQAGTSEKFICIVGSSGIGKTTALIGEVDSRISLNEGSKNIGYGGQDSAVLPGGLKRNTDLTFSPKDSELSKPLLELATKLGIRDELDRFVDVERTPDGTVVLSGGQVTRLELLRAHANLPDLIFLDEPTNGLDQDSIKKLAEFLNGNDAKYVIVTHDKMLISKLKGVRVIDFDNL